MEGTIPLPLERATLGMTSRRIQKTQECLAVSQLGYGDASTSSGRSYTQIDLPIRSSGSRELVFPADFLHSRHTAQSAWHLSFNLWFLTQRTVLRLAIKIKEGEYTGWGSFPEARSQASHSHIRFLHTSVNYKTARTYTIFMHIQVSWYLSSPLPTDISVDKSSVWLFKPFWKSC